MLRACAAPRLGVARVFRSGWPDAFDLIDEAPRWARLTVASRPVPPGTDAHTPRRCADAIASHSRTTRVRVQREHDRGSALPASPGPPLRLRSTPRGCSTANAYDVRVAVQTHLSLASTVAPFHPAHLIRRAGGPAREGSISGATTDCGRAAPALATPWNLGLLPGLHQAQFPTGGKATDPNARSTVPNPMPVENPKSFRRIAV